MGGKEDCNVCMFSVVWYDKEAWEKIPGSLEIELRNGFVATPTGMTVYCKLQKKFFPPSYWCKAWRGI
jgi:hypothetical protein